MHTDRFWLGLTTYFRPPIFKTALWGRLIATVLLLAIIALDLKINWLKPLLILIILLVSLSLSFRAVYGLDGAHQMNLMIYIALFFYFLLPETSFGRAFCILFIAAQSIMSYVISGIFKLRGESWRKGQAISGIMTTKIYGNRFVGGILMKKPVVCFVLSWAVILFESLFIVTAFGNGHLLFSFLAIGLFFHFSNALLMGLNGFLFAFVATYPAIIYLNHFLLNL